MNEWVEGRWDELDEWDEWDGMSDGQTSKQQQHTVKKMS